MPTSPNRNLSLQKGNLTSVQPIQEISRPVTETPKPVTEKINSKVSSPLKSSQIYGDISKSILRVGGATSEEMALGKVSSQRMGEIFSQFTSKRGIRVFSSAAHMRSSLEKAGNMSNEQIERAVQNMTRSIGTSTPGGVIYIASKEELVQKGYKGDLNRLRLMVGLHEGIESELFRTKKSVRILSHQDVSIYKSEFELISLLDKGAVKKLVETRSKEIPQALKIIKGWNDELKSKYAIGEIESLPGHFKSVLQSRGYSSSDISELVSPITKVTTRGKIFPKEKILESYQLGLKKIKEVIPSIKEKITGPPKRVEKVAAQKVVTKTIAKEVQNVKELVRPATISDQVSSGVKALRKFGNAGILKAILPVAVGGAVIADVLGSREKTGPFWGAITGALSYVAARAKFSGLTAAGIAVAGYIGGRTVANTLEGQHDGQGFQEIGEAAISRKQLTDFGSGYKGLKKTLEVLGSTISETAGKIGSMATQAKSIALANTTSATPKLDIVSKWNQILSENMKKGLIQEEIKEKQIASGIFESLLPTIKKDPLKYAGKTVTRKGNQLMEFKRDDISRAIEEYAKEKGLPLPKIRETNTTPASISQVKRIETVRDYRKAVGSAPTIAPGGFSQVIDNLGTGKTFLDIGRDKTLMSQADIGHMKTMVGEATANTMVDIGSAKTIKDIGNLKTVNESNNLRKGRNALLSETIQDFSNMKTLQAPPNPDLHKDLAFSRTIQDIGPLQTLTDIAAAPTINVPSPVGKESTSTSLHNPKIAGSQGKLKITSEVDRVQQAVNKGASWMSQTFGADFSNAQSDGALYRRGHPRVLEGMQDTGVSGARRKGFTDFGSGKDAARELLRAMGLFKKTTPDMAKAVKKTLPEAEEMAFETALASPQFQELLGKGKKVKSLGEGGIGSVDLMEVDVLGEKFQYARKSYFKDSSGVPLDIINDEQRGLNVLKESIGPTPYGRGRIVGDKGEPTEVMYMEYVPGGKTGTDYARLKGGLKENQIEQLKKGIKTLHERNLSHTDFKLDNVMIDKDGDAFLIDPMPGRLKSQGLEKYGVGEKDIIKMQQAQDLVSVERLSQGGMVESMISDMRRIANVPTAAVMGEAAPWGVKSVLYDQWIEKVYRKADVPQIEDIWRQSRSVYEGNLRLKEAQEVLKHQNAAGFQTSKAGLESKTPRAGRSGIESKTPAARPQSRPSMQEEAATRDFQARKGMEKQTKATSNLRRQKLHEQSIEQMTANLKTPSRRHRTT
jgi:hypothetical protein